MLVQVSRTRNRWQGSVRRCRGEDFVQLHVPQILVLPPQAVLGHKGYKEKLRAVGSVLAADRTDAEQPAAGAMEERTQGAGENPLTWEGCVFAGTNNWHDVCGFLAGHKAQRKQVQYGKGLLVVSAAFNPLINAREIQQNSKGLKNKISSSCCLVLQFLFLFPFYFLIIIREGWEAFVRVLL